MAELAGVCLEGRVGDGPTAGADMLGGVAGAIRGKGVGLRGAQSRWSGIDELIAVVDGC